MFLDLTDQQKALQLELRNYFTALMTPEVKARVSSADFAENTEYKALIRQIGADGWLGVGWPTEYGGRGFTPIEQYIFFDESQAAGCPIPFLSTNTVGPTIRDFGNEVQKDFFLPKVLSGEMHFSIGYSEPDAGTDLAALQTRAVLDGDHWVINGQKLYTSLAYNADYIWLAARTDQEGGRHKGITVFLVDTNDPGFSIQPFETFGQTHTTATFYQDVRVPDAMRVGDINGGWSLITNQLNHERVSLFPGARLVQITNEAVAWTRTTVTADGRRLIDHEWVRIALAECRSLARHLDLLNWYVAAENTAGRVNPAYSSSIKVHGSESMHRVYTLLTQVMGATGVLRVGAPGATILQSIEASYRSVWVMTFGGGTNEVQRDIIAMAGLGLPREKRRQSAESSTAARH
ncbi:MAG: acyl-CoA dehydrogenase family protein [Acidimicrobiales bacterium]|nr:acyl-CoA dehydrogenase family protein [Acidimicrobiales bacterium]